MPTMKLKLDAQGHVVLQDGKPVYVHDDGKEIAFDAPGTLTKIAQLNEEAKTHRLAAKAAAEKLAAYEGIDDAEAARKALAVVANLDAKKLIDAGEAEKVRSEIKAAYEAKLGEAKKALEAKESEIYRLQVGGAFANSKFVADRLTVPRDMIEAAFGRNFKVEDGKVVAYDASGNRILSRERPGEPAGFDEALETLVSSYPHKEAILKAGKPGSGGGGPGNGVPPSGTKPKQMTVDQKVAYIEAHGREAYEALVQADKQ